MQWNKPSCFNRSFHAIDPLQPGHETELDGWLRKKFEGQIGDSEIVQREDLDLVGFGYGA